MTINPDKIIMFRAGAIAVNATIVYTWVVMAVLIGFSILVTRKLSLGPNISKRQHVLESVVSLIQDQIKGITGREHVPYFPYVATLFLFILVSNVLHYVPHFHAPTGSLSTTAALACTVFAAVPFFGIRERGFFDYLQYYLEPVFVMLPLNILTEFTRTVALSIRLFGNIMSEGLIAAILLLIAPFFVPVLMHLLGLLIGIVQAYIFFILATVFIGSAATVHTERGQNSISISTT
ncbi:MAG: F0F1 ATP synthase subunit A [Spirochaetota bacterium]